MFTSNELGKKPTDENQIKHKYFQRVKFVLQWQVYHFRNKACSRTHIHIRYHTLVGVKFLSDTKTKETKKVKLLFLKELKQKQNVLV